MDVLPSSLVGHQAPSGIKLILTSAPLHHPKLLNYEILIINGSNGFFPPSFLNSLIRLYG